MRRLAAVLTAAALAGCAEAPTQPAARSPGDVALSEFPPGAPCVYFTKDGEEITGSTDCEVNAFGLDISFAGAASFGFSNGATAVSPRGINGVRFSFQPQGPNAGQLTGMQWMQGSRVIPQEVLPSGVAGTSSFDVDVMRFTDVRWVGGGKISVPKGANDLHYEFFVID